MGSFQSKTNRLSSFSDQAKNFEQFFEAQLSAIGLADSQLSTHPLIELRDSLETLNDAIRSPDAFGRLHLRFDERIGLFITSVGAESHIQLGALTLLLKKKKYVLERLRALEANETVNELRENLTVEKDVEKQRSLEEKIRALEEQSHVWLERSEAFRKVDIAENLEAAAKRAAIANESFERRAKVWQEFFARESVATLIGAVLVVAVTGVLIFSNKEIPSVVTNDYLVVIGFFFSQSMSKAKALSGKANNVSSGNET